MYFLCHSHLCTLPLLLSLSRFFLLLDSSEPTVARLLHRYLSTSPYPHLFFWLLRSSSLLTICVYLCVLGPCCGSYPPNYIIFVSRAPVCFRTAAHGSDPGPGPQRRMSPCPRSSTARHAQCQDQPSPANIGAKVLQHAARLPRSHYPRQT